MQTNDCKNWFLEQFCVDFWSLLYKSGLQNIEVKEMSSIHTTPKKYKIERREYPFYFTLHENIPVDNSGQTKGPYTL